MNEKNGTQPRNEHITEDQQAIIDALAIALTRASQQNAETVKPTSKPNEVKSIDLVELFFLILSKWIFVVIAAVVGGLLMGLLYQQSSYSYYTATSKLYIVGSQGTTINISDLQLGSMLKLDYEEVFKTWEVHEMVRESLDLDYSYTQLQSMLTVQIPEDTRILYISIRHQDAQMATDLANAYAQAAKNFILMTMESEEPNIFSVALLPTTPTTVTTSSRVIIGILLGTVCAIGLITLLFVFDDRPRTPDDIARIAGIPTLAIIPASTKSNNRKFLRRTKGSEYETN